MKMQRFVLYLFLFFLEHFYFACSSCIEPSNCTFFELKCKAGYQIYSPKFWGTSVKCGHYDTTCRGLTPNVMIEKTNCYWQPNCTIEVPGQYDDNLLVRLEEGISDYRCFTKRIYSIREANNWTCVNSSAVYTICGTTGKNITPADGLTGIIKSHELYPWNYDDQLFSQNECVNNPSPVPISCHVVFDVFLLPGHNYSRVAVSIDGNIDIDDEYDKLTFYGGIWATQDKKTYINTYGQQLVLNFSRREMCDEGGYKNGRGFVMCYKYLISGEMIPYGMSVCDQVLEKPEVKARCIKCEYQPADKGTSTYCDTEHNTTDLVVTLTDGSDHERCAKNKTVAYATCYCKYNTTHPVNAPLCNVDTGRLEKTLQKQDDSHPTCKLFKIVTEKCVCRYRYRKKTRCIGENKMRVGKLKKNQPSFCPPRHLKTTDRECRQKIKRKKGRKSKKGRKKHRGSKKKGSNKKSKSKKPRRGRLTNIGTTPETTK